jgi:hypothetical protein
VDAHDGPATRRCIVRVAIVPHTTARIIRQPAAACVVVKALGGVEIDSIRRSATRRIDRAIARRLL